ncbi:DUF885 domain-containing protein [Gordonia hongkongensis]|uniref:DUF2268 domain-containing protein n=1 Tax=Gordonia hongkongensis TaxID=1701090 RepID=A0AAX3TAP1_9ACTN|nr:MULTISPECIES: DUF885 domain-containing protein [Gordonia]OCW87652.1 DUF885 domain-containing protein [Nocardia farcinica]QIK48769.1 DUF2268 domain-containing protein [Gordonia terrae]MBN0971442.1 DUF885 domain-containing protein [Gordonia sp. BP-119]MBN0982185.1 DUF885 domain-containing protein [Gordonia sp. BP-94]MDF6100167.1 DUF2268 domain-containing protein [Gordonia hongkongensis]
MPSPTVADTDHASDPLVAEYLRLGLAFDRLERGFVDAYTGDPALKAEVENAPAPDPARLADRARGLLADLPGALDAARAEFIGAHLRALECSARKFAGDDVGFIDEVRAYFDVDIAMADPDRYRQAHADLAEALGVPGATGDELRDIYAAHRRADEIPPERVDECVRAFSSALRERVRSAYPLPDNEIVEFEVVTDKPWSGFNYYLGNYRSRVAINADLTQYMSSLPALIAHEAYPGHHTEHCRKEQLLVGAGHDEQSIFLVNTPQCLMAEGLADHALAAIVGPEWGTWAQEIYADLGLRFDAGRAMGVGRATAGLLGVRQDAALLLHDRHADADTVAEHLRRWLLAPEERARQMLRFLTSPLWRAYISTYVEGYRLLEAWLEQADDRAAAFGRLLDEPLIPASLRRELL